MKSFKIILIIMAIAITGVYMVTIASAQGNGEYTDFSFPGVSSVEVDGSIIPTRIMPSSDGISYVEKQNWPENVETEIYRRGSKLIVKVAVKPFTMTVNSQHARLLIRVPLNADVSVDLSTGSITAENLQADKFRFKTSTGRINMSGLTGSINAETSTGSVDASNIQGRLTINTSTGSVDLEKTMGVIAVRTSTGSIRGDRVDAETGSRFTCTTGSINLDLTDESLTVEGETNTGTLRMFGQSFRKKGKTGNGRADIYVKAGTGSIELY